MSDCDMPDPQPASVSASAAWALERLSEVRYGRDAPALGWSVSRELISAGFITFPSGGRSGVSITAAGRAYLKSQK
ncbi:hypothetical protein [Paraburkholderia caffeinitolerans]|uniref:hypothetical protein n=1 Tax=Paraburkholderia caffeinitolerans TaxID=1723730 RepID=UPI0015837F46|nr:hypothetical protein [Paraburkholderia caffeinitolerans]